jgi:hypothetical protein
MGKLFNIFSNVLAENAIISVMNEEKIQESIDRYKSASILPRKTKKKVRKEAFKDYTFWKSMLEYHNNLFKH